ncbi:hypothetical protein [Novosphingobium sp. Chol11]|uniref:hypothetical protein n=1 Tax=Novosphingobium sp. Chol11 TaxID=1385763 RepID=UPI0025F3BC05|nr:hypothetical protein [Novosphingobium sp. Chol11]
MKINRSVVCAPVQPLLTRAPAALAAVLAAMLGLASCAAPPPLPLTPPMRASSGAALPAPRPVQVVRPATPPAAREAAQTPGSWTYTAEKGGTAARFAATGAMPLLVLRCDSARRMIILLRPAPGQSAVAASISTSSGTRNIAARPAANVKPAALAIELDPQDRVLDQMAFSKGRFTLDISGLPTLVLPAWAEVGRVIEDCR